MSSNEVIVFVIFNLSYTYMSSVRSGSLLCQVIDPRPVSYLEHCLGASSKYLKLPITTYNQPAT